MIIKQVEQARIENSKLRGQLSDFTAPSVMKAVQYVAESDEIEKQLKTWARRVELAELRMKDERTTWRSVSRIVLELSQRSCTGIR